MKTRLAYLDNLKVLLTVLVIILHASAAYGGPTNFSVAQAADSALARLVFAAIAVRCQPFVLGCYFFIAGYLTPPAQAGHGTQFLRRRLRQLGLPLLAYDLLGERLIAAEIALAEQGWPAARTAFWATPLVIGSGPLWFVERLLCLTLLWVLAEKWLAPVLVRLRLTAPTIGWLCGGLGLVSFAVRIVWPFQRELQFLSIDFPWLPLQYPAYFLLGIAAYRNQELARLDRRAALHWLLSAWVVLGFFGGLYVYGGGLDHPLLFAGGLRWQSLAAALFEQYFGLALTLGLLGVFQQWGNRPWPAWLARPTFWVYGLHAPLLVAVWLLLRRWTLPSLVAFGLTSVTTVGVSWGLALVILEAKKRWMPRV